MQQANRLACLILMLCAAFWPRPITVPADSESPAQEKIAVPSAAVQRDALKQVNDVYGDEIAKAKTPDQKGVLARKLLKKSEELNNDPVEKYVSLGLARDLAIAGADPENALAAVTAMEPYQIDGPKAKADALLAISKSVRTPQAALAFVGTAETAAEEALAADRYDLALQTTKLAATSAKTTNDPGIQAKVNRQMDDIREMQAASVEARKATKTIAENPNDSHANLVAGRFECFFKARWEAGLPLLKSGSDANLRILAESELSHPSTPAKQVELADGWWNESGKEKGLVERNLKDHAAQWYRSAIPNLEGLARAKVDKRLAAIQAAGSFHSKVWIDLLKSIDIERDLIGGDWSMDGQRLVVRAGATPARLRITAKSEANYELQIEFERPAGGDALGVYLPVGSGGVVLMLQTRRMGLDQVDGKRYSVNETTRSINFDDLKKHVLDIAVSTTDSDARIAVLADGKKTFEWKGMISKLTVDAGWTMPEPMSFGFGSWNTAFVISGARLRGL